MLISETGSTAHANTETKTGLIQESAPAPMLRFSEPRPNGDPPEILTDRGSGKLVTCPVHQQTPMLILRTRNDVLTVLKRSDLFGFAGIPQGLTLTGAELQDPDGGLLRCDDPKFALAIRPIFSARRVSRSRGPVEALADRLAHELRPDEDGAVDFKQYSESFVAHAVCAAMGLPVTSWEFLLRASRVAFGVIEHSEAVPVAKGMWEELYAFYARVVQDKRARPDGRIASEVIRVFDARGFTDLQTVHTLATISNGFPAALPVLDVSMLELLRRPAMVDECQRNPARWRAVISECIRHRALFPVALPRCATDDVTLNGRHIAAGTVVLPSLVAAAHDPRQEPSPGKFVADREQAASNIAFGAGPHFCPGAAHTRLWLEVALSAFFARFPTARLAGSESIEWQAGTLSTPKTIRMEVAS
jgi:cytochrome P450